MLDSGLDRILTVQAEGPGWLEGHRAQLRALVPEHGAVRVRGLGLSDPSQVRDVFRILGTGLMRDDEAFAQRRHYADGVYSSAAWPDHQRMCMHQELSYRLEVPGLAMFACLTAPTTGGETGIADASAVLDALPSDVVDRFERHGWLLSRTYGGDIGPSVADSFGTDDRAAVEDYCRRNAIDLEWLADGGLRTRQRRPAIVTHPVTGLRCWFNQVAFLSEWAIDPEIREFLVDMYGDDGLPFTTAFGNGDVIDAGLMDLINTTYDAHTVLEPWRDGDLLLVDNLRTAHSREAFVGDRVVLVGLSDPTRVVEPASEVG